MVYSKKSVYYVYIILLFTVQALYGSTYEPGQFNYASYMYLLAPISLVIINPIAFLMMEYWKQSHHKRVTCAHLPKLILSTLKGVRIIYRNDRT